MPRHATPFDLWQGGFQLAALAVETQLVIAYRLLGLAGFWAVAEGENQRMVAEKAPAFWAATQAASRAALLGRRPDEIVGAYVRPLRMRTRRNARRLGKRGPRLG